MSTSTIMKISHQGQIRIPKKIMISLGIDEEIENDQLSEKFESVEEGLKWLKED
jgi:bifunctional DNA-binding transcriptional regulator/antitoxin component of YhaV-PrlF toxin-antitoxin module